MSERHIIWQKCRWPTARQSYSSRLVLKTLACPKTERRREGPVNIKHNQNHVDSLLFHKHSWRGLSIVQPRQTKSPWDSPPPACLTHPEVIPWKAGSHSCTLLLIWPPSAWRLPTSNSHLTRQDEMEKTRLTVWKLRPQVEFNNAVKENNTHSLRHGAKKSNIEKNQNPRIIPCELHKSCSLSQLVCRWLQPGGFGAGGGSSGQRLHQRLLCRCKPTILVILSSNC